MTYRETSPRLRPNAIAEPVRSPFFWPNYGGNCHFGHSPERALFLEAINDEIQSKNHGCLLFADVSDINP
jgi:hypothetical protein